MGNHLVGQTSPYLLQHANNPVDWYPWGDEAFEKAQREDKPVFLSIGYSTCHWCHVMAHESFEDEAVASLLNDNFVSIKVDREERPDIDSVYMAVCLALNGSGGWPATIFMTPDKQPFFAGSYFPVSSRYGMIGFRDLLSRILEKWKNEREGLLTASDELVRHLRQEQTESGSIDSELIDSAVHFFKRTFDRVYGGFGDAPKFPAAHNLLFLLDHYEKSEDAETLAMVEKTLRGMYRGGLFDHIGYGFSRYSTDPYYLVPHFEKMLYDNALLIMAYACAYSITGNSLYRDVAEKTATYLTREMFSPQKAFYSAQDADSEGVEGKYYVLSPKEILELLGETDGVGFNAYYDITEAGNFEGKSIPNLLKNDNPDGRYDSFLPRVYAYRKARHELPLDDKILSGWNSMMIVSFTLLYRVTRTQHYLEIAQSVQSFIEDKLSKEDTLFVSYRDGKTSGEAFLDDYAYYCLALISLYEATLENSYLDKAQAIGDKALADFYDGAKGGFFLGGTKNEKLFINPKEVYDGALPSGNSVMAYCLVRLGQLTEKEAFESMAEKQLAFMSGQAARHPAGHSFFLLALASYINPPDSIVVVLPPDSATKKIDLVLDLGLKKLVKVLKAPTKEYALLNDQVTYYVCKGRACLPPTNKLNVL